MDKLRSPLIKALVLLMILVTNLRHLVAEYSRLSGDPASIWVWASLVAIDCAVFLFVIHGRKTEAMLFMIAVGLISFRHLAFDEGNTARFLFYADYVESLLFAGIFAFGIYSFSELFLSDMSHQEIVRRGSEPLRPDWLTEEKFRQMLAKAGDDLASLGNVLAKESETAAKKRRTYLRGLKKHGTINGQAKELELLEIL